MLPTTEIYRTQLCLNNYCVITFLLGPNSKLQINQNLVQKYYYTNSDVSTSAEVYEHLGDQMKPSAHN